MSIRTILNNHLGIKYVVVPKDLNFLQEFNRMCVAEDLLERVHFDLTVMQRIFTGLTCKLTEWRLPTESKPKQPR